MDLTKIRKLIEDNQFRTKQDTGGASVVDTSPEEDKKNPAGKKDSTPKTSDSNPNQKLPPIGGKTTLTGQQPNNVDIEPGLYPKEVKEGRTAVVAFGRMNPPTIGHTRLVEMMEHIAKEVGGTALLFLSHSHDAKKNPLVYESKLAYAQYAFGDVVVESNANDIIAVATEVAESYDNIIFVCGSDRQAEFERKLNRYNGDLYEFNQVHVTGLSRSNYSSDPLECASGSILREAAHEDNFGLFKKWLAPGVRYFAENIYAEVRGELNELNTQQRAKRALIFRRNKARVKQGRDRAIRRRAPSAALGKRSRRLAIKLMRRRILRGQKYQDLSYAQRATVDKRLKKRKKSIGRIAKRLLPKVARAEASRKIGSRFVDPMGGRKNVSESMLLEMMKFLPEAEYDYELTDKEVQSLQEKASEYETSYAILETVFRRGIAMWENIQTDMTFSQYGFCRVNSFLNGGKAYDMDFDMVVEDCEHYASTKDKDEDADHDGEIEQTERAAIDSRALEKVITTKPSHNGFHRHQRGSVSHRTSAEPGKAKRAELVRKVYEMVHPELRGRIADDSKKSVDWAKRLKKMRDRRSEVAEDAIPNASGDTKRRCDMPQLTNFDAFHKDLSDSGHSLGHDYVKPDTLTPTQKHFNREKVDKLKKGGWGDKGIIVSKDNYVVDGHHRWLAAHENGDKIKARRTSLNRDELLDFLKNKPYVEKKTLDEETE